MSKVVFLISSTNKGSSRRLKCNIFGQKCIFCKQKMHGLGRPLIPLMVFYCVCITSALINPVFFSVFKILQIVNRHERLQSVRFIVKDQTKIKKWGVCQHLFTGKLGRDVIAVSFTHLGLAKCQKFAAAIFKKIQVKHPEFS